MDYKKFTVGDIFQYDGKFYKVFPDDPRRFSGCIDCAFEDMTCERFECVASERPDRIGVIFREYTPAGSVLKHPVLQYPLLKEIAESFKETLKKIQLEAVMSDDDWAIYLQNNNSNNFKR